MDFQCSCLLWEEDFDLTGSVLGFSFWRWFIEIPLLDVVCGGIVITVGLSFKYGDLLALTQGPSPRSRSNSRLFFVYFAPLAERMLAGGLLKHADTYATIDDGSV